MRTKVAICCAVIFCAASAAGPRSGAQAQGANDSGSASRALLSKYCVICHNDRLRTAGLSLADIDADNIPARAEVWDVRQSLVDTIVQWNRLWESRISLTRPWSNLRSAVHAEVMQDGGAAHTEEL